MELFSESKTILNPILKEPFSLEREIQTIVETNLDTLFNLDIVRSEFIIGEFRLDTLAFDEQSNSFVILEYKVKSNFSVIDQGYSYLSTMINSKADFVLEYNESMDRNLKRDDVDWSSTRVLFVAPAFTRYQKNSVNFQDVPFELWEIERFKGGLITIEQHQSGSNESINKITGGNPNSVISKVNAEVKRVSEEELEDKLSDGLKDVWLILREKLSDYPNTSFYTTTGYVGWKKGTTTISFIRLQKSQIRADILRGNKSEAGAVSRGFFTLDDPKGMSKEAGWNWKTGKTGHSYQIKITKLDQIDYVLYLLNQKYEAL